MNQRVTIKGHEGQADQLMTADQIVQGLMTLLRESRLDEAVDVYMRCQDDLGFALMAAAKVETSLLQQVANLFYRARDYGKAAMVCEELEAYDKAAEFYGLSGEHEMAAHMAARVGNHLLAAQSFERCSRYAEAAGLYEKAENLERAAACYERAGAFLNAARAFVGYGCDARAISCLQRIEPTEADAVEAAAMLVLALDRQDQRAHAAAHAVAALGQLEPRAVQVDAWLDLVGYANAVGHVAEALEGVRTYLGVVKRGDTRALELEKNLLKRLEQAPQAPAAPAPVALGTANAVTGVMRGFDVLKALPVFAELTLEQLRAVHALTTVVSPAAGEVVIAPGAPAAALFVVLSGAVHVHAATETQSAPLATLGLGEPVGEMSWLDQAPSMAAVRAAADTTLLRVDGAGLSALAEADPSLAMRVYRALARELASRVRDTSAAAAKWQAAATGA